MLSQWWTGEEDADIFWRSVSSGGRAKTRGQQGRSSSAGHGDIIATDPIGKPLIDLLTIEIKKGYKATHVAEIFDKPDRLNPCEFEQWLKQVTESASQAKSYSWAIIHRRTKRNPILYMPWKMVEALKPLGVMNKPWKIFFTFHATIQMRTEVKFKGRPKKTLVRFERHRISGVRLDEWLERVTPRLLLRLHKKVAA